MPNTGYFTFKIGPVLSNFFCIEQCNNARDIDKDKCLGHIKKDCNCSFDKEFVTFQYFKVFMRKGEKNEFGTSFKKILRRTIC